MTRTIPRANIPYSTIDNFRINPPVGLFAVNRKCEQYVSGHRVAGITRRHIQRSAGDDRRHADDGAAVRFHSIDRLKFLSSVEIPDDFAAFGFISPDMSVLRSEERHARSHSNGTGLSSAASRCGNTRWFGGFGQPELLAGGELNGNESASGFGFARSKVRNAKVAHALIVTGTAPHGAAVDPSHRDFLFPDDRAFTIRIDAIDHSRLVANHQDAFPGTDRSQNSRVAEISIDKRKSRTIRFVLGGTREVPAVVFGKLLRPQDAARIHF